MNEELTPDEKNSIRRQFVVSACNLRHFQVFWVPTERRIIARAVVAARRFYVPDEAVLVGTYAHPFRADAFIGDLVDVIAARRRAQRPSPGSPDRGR